MTLACRAGSAIAQRFLAEGFPLLPLPLWGELDLRSARRLAHYCREREMEIMHAHLARDYPIAALASLAAPQVRLVMTRHVIFPLRMLLLQRFVLRRVKAVIAVCAALKPMLVRDSGVPEELIHVIPNGIDTAAFAGAPAGWLRADLGLPAETPLVGVVAQVKPYKGIDTFLRPFRPSARRTRRHISSSSAACRSRRMWRNCGHSPGNWGSMRRSGWPARRYPRDHARPGSAVLPSRAGETFTLVLLEAMAAGTAVVATKIGGIPEIVGDNERGLLIEPDAPDTLAAAVNALLAHPERRAQYARAGQQYARRQFDISIMVELPLNSIKK